MRAIGLFEYGGPEVLRVLDLPEPHAGQGEMRIRVRAAAINPADVMLREGLLRESYEGVAPPFVPGMDIAGTIDEVGDNVDERDMSIGDDVVGLVDNHGSHGGYSEFVVLPAASVTRMSHGASFAEAASFLMNALTARTALDALALPPSSTLAVTGGAGAFGGYVIQLAAHEGIRVIADASADDRPLLQSFGAERVVERGNGLAERVLEIVPNGVDALADGARIAHSVVPAIRDGGQIVVVRAWSGEPGRGITTHRINVRHRATDAEAIGRIRDQVEDGILATCVAAVYPAEDVVHAHGRLDAGRVRGRIVLEF